MAQENYDSSNFDETLVHKMELLLGRILQIWFSLYITSYIDMTDTRNVKNIRRALSLFFFRGIDNILWLGDLRVFGRESFSIFAS